MSEYRSPGEHDVSSPLHLITILYRSSKSFPGFLNGLQAQDRTDWRLHVIDNGDPQSLAVAEARADPRISITRNPANVGFARAANQGMREALAEGAKTLLLMNNDVTIPPDLLGALSAAEKALPCAIMSPRLMYTDRPDVCGYSGGKFEQGWIYESVRYPYDPAATEPEQVEFAPGCCLLIPARVLDRIGFLDERFFVYWEDVDFCLRATAAGVPIYYLPKISMLHKGSESTDGAFSPAYTKLFYVAYIQFLKKHFGLRGAVGNMLRVLLREWQEGRYRKFWILAGLMLKGLAS